MTTRYLALLRGINVGASGRIRMDALKRLMEDAGFLDVETYIQSGNVLFSSNLSEENTRETIQRALKEGADIMTTTILRTMQELDELIRRCPFSTDEIAKAQTANTEGESFYVCLLPEESDAQSLSKLTIVELGNDLCVFSGRNIYLLLSQSIRTSKFVIRLQKLFPDMTVRNWNTMTKLHELAQCSNGG
jgi:uncharacterized protein (DUF1697 family)